MFLGQAMRDYVERSVVSMSYASIKGRKGVARFGTTTITIIEALSGGE
jgi:hypothetical protein